MILIERSARVDAPIETVWEVVQQAERLPEWMAGVRRVEVVSGDGVGRRQRVHAADGTWLDAEVIAYEPPKLFSWRERTEGSGSRAEARTEVYVELTPAEDDEATDVRLTLVRWPSGPVSAALLRLGIRRVGADLEASLARLGTLAKAAIADRQTVSQGS
ncbi:MAG: SRPBCC family protein [Actinobacteria bacterium]|nr:MAG: SRPBCC family protein [Actinomycetota bacterium]